MTDVDITELDVLQASKVSGVATAANGTPFLLLKAAEDAADEDPLAENRKRMKEGKPLVKKDSDDDEDDEKEKEDEAEAEAEKSDSAESDEFEEEVLKAGAYCGNPNCGNCKALGVVNKALSAAERKEMPAKSFAYVDPKGGKHLPIHDKGHVKAALGRFKSTDFTEADKPVAAKKKAAAKIKAAAATHGIEISDDSDVAEAAKKGTVQDGLNGTATPQEVGHLATGQSSTSGSVTAGVRPGRSDPSLTLGGETTAAIPDVTKVDHDSPIPATTDGAGILNTAAKSVAVASLAQAMDVLSAQREAIKDGKFLQVANPTAAEAANPGSLPWESYDSATLAQVATCLAGCCNALDSIKQREAIEIATNNGDNCDLWDLQDVSYALENAMGIAARLAFQEAAEGASAEDVVKNLDIEQLLEVRKTLDDTIVQVTNAGSAGTTEGVIHMDVTKDELAETIAAGTVAAVEAAFKAKANAKAEKRAEKEKAAAEEAEKNANNDGDVTEADLKPTKEVDADNINAVKDADKDTESETDPATKALADQLESLTKSLDAVQEQVTKFAKRPRAGGPSLDGQARGVTPAGEGRVEGVTKSTEDVDIEGLQKSIDAETDPVRKSELGLKLTYARLVQMHESGQL